LRKQLSLGSQWLQIIPKSNGEHDQRTQNDDQPSWSSLAVRRKKEFNSQLYPNESHGQHEAAEAWNRRFMRVVQIRAALKDRFVMEEPENEWH
jgi:hypothetical protein